MFRKYFFKSLVCDLIFINRKPIQMDLLFRGAMLRPKPITTSFEGPTGNQDHIIRNTAFLARGRPFSRHHQNRDQHAQAQ